ncbi:hypothetical protein H310_11109 [Aphanomyces invadans]|uniref:Uncharacterized protein n=1 Tax=Aphanomyces invadans TaxID=157072 RepID=A0A024TNU5_9STRA|nr:hypothetical protein H310_11109 [Aphanomyces invadans]ETV95693.1 hypothetical protein H310_11109 [Aphanomyces invadans]|eukprot:XP_008875886.1 hypothetical protein H310_11109 [Aphanomyces invadans]
MSNQPERPDVKLHAKSVFLSACFFVNLLFMPLKGYLSEVSPFASDASYDRVQIGQLTFDASEFAQYLPLLYNASTIDPGVVYFYDSQYGVDVMRSVVKDDAQGTLNPVYSILGVPYFPADLKQSWPRVLTNNSSIEPLTIIAWNITVLTAPASMSVIWVVPGNDLVDCSQATKAVSTVYYVYRPVVKILFWRLFKAFYRLCLVVWIFVLTTKHYYCHVRHLHTSLQIAPLHANSRAARYEIVVGEPTCLVLSSPWLCLMFVMDICASTEYVGQACLRVCQTENWFYFALGLLYLGRTVWCAYTTLTLLNVVLKHFNKASFFTPANTTILAMVATCAGGGVVAIQKQWPQVLDLYTTLFLPNEICTGGSVYPLFQHAPDFQAQCTISQRGGDCYVLSYDKHDRLIEVTRVTLASQIDRCMVAHPLQINEVTTAAAVGRLVVTKRDDMFSTAMFHRGLADSPWVA